MPLSFEVLKSDESELVIALKGERDAVSLSNHEAQFHALLNNQNSLVILDFSEINFMASLGIRMLLIALKDLKRRGFGLKIKNPIEEVEKVFIMTGLTELLQESK
jgi:anti-sigma B factor antagonist